MRVTYAGLTVIALAAGLAVSSPAATIEKVQVNAGLDLISISGTIVAGDDRRFINLALSSPRSVVALESDGGALTTAIEIGKGIRLKGFSTWVPEGATCTSACALIWLAGSPRLKSATARVGFHASYSEQNGTPAPASVGNALVGRYLTELNLPQQAVVFATEAPPEQIEWLSDAAAERAGISYRAFDVPAVPQPTAGRESNLNRKRAFPKSTAVPVGGEAMKGLAAAIKQQVQPCYELGELLSTPAIQIITTLRLRYNKDGSVAGNPQIVEQTGITRENRIYAQQIADIARRAVLRCSPLHLPAELYEGGWDDLNFRFTPGVMQ